MQLRVYKEAPNAKLPTKAHGSDHCWDLYASKDTEIHDECTVIVETGIRIEPPIGYALIVKERSGLATKGIIIGAGVIDTSYRGPLNVVMRYLKPSWLISKSDAFKIKTGDKIAQFKLEKTIEAEVIEISKEEFNLNTERGERGFGSSDNRMNMSGRYT